MHKTIHISDVSLPARPRTGHKGTFGRVLVVAGSRGMSGAAFLSGSGALRTGAGLVTIAVPRCIQNVVAIGQPCVTTLALDDDDLGQVDVTACVEVEGWIGDRDAIAVGPGLGTGAGVKELVGRILSAANCPVLLDADALNVCAGTGLLSEVRDRVPCVVTPHPREFSRLTGLSATEILGRPVESALSFARQTLTTVVLKGHNSVVTDGDRVYVNQTGNSGMGTGGSGDVLSGVIAALIAQGLPVFDAAVVGTCLHGIAGDLCADRLSEEALIASDLLASLGAAWKILRSGQARGAP